MNDDFRRDPHQGPLAATSVERENSTALRSLVAIAAFVSLASFVVYYRAGDILLYGDAVAHINIARRVFDSRTPGLLQLGTVWLPLQHLLILPFVVNGWLWRTGMGGALPSMVAYVLGVAGIFRLTRALLSSIEVPPKTARAAAFAASAIYGLNPNLLYLQTTAMTEPLYLALFVWSAVYLQEFVSATHGHLSNATPLHRRTLWKSGLCAAAASCTRYDGWFLSATLAGVVAVLYLRARKTSSGLSSNVDSRPERHFGWLFRFLLLLAAVPALWLAYNAIIYRNPFEFANGPYSAKAIEQKSQSASFQHPGAHNFPLAALYFVKCAEINVAQGAVGWVWLLLALAGTAALVRKSRLATPALLWSPILFYGLSVAYGSVPIYMPDWFPRTAYNVRYGLELLPAFAVLTPIAVLFVMQWMRTGTLQRIVAITAILLAAASYSLVALAHPVCYREAFINSRTRLALESRLATELSSLPDDASFLMYLGNHVGALQQAGISLKRSVNEGNHRVWMQPTDPDGLWERSLKNPSDFVDYVVAIEGDPVAEAMSTRTLPVLARVQVEGQASAAIYRARGSVASR